MRPNPPTGRRARTRQMLARAGYELPAERMSVRLVHLLDETRRKELMIIYAEDLALSGYTAAQLRTARSRARSGKPSNESWSNAR
jgi:hypothetical protein